MIPGTLTINQQEREAKRLGGPHVLEMNTWTGRAASTGRLRGSYQPWATSPPKPNMMTLRSLTAPAKPVYGNTSTAETDVPSWEHRTKIQSLRGQTQPNLTSSLTRGSAIDVKSTIPIGFRHTAGPYNQWSTQRTDRPSWENRLTGGATGRRGQADPWARTLTDAPPGGKHPEPTGDTGKPPDMNATSTAALDLDSWHQRMTGKGPYTGSLTGSLRGNTIPNMRGLGQGNLVLQDPKTMGRIRGKAPFDPNVTSTAAVDTASWEARLGVSVAHTGTRTRGQHDPYAQTLTEYKGTGARAQGQGLTGTHGSKGLTMGTWSFAGGSSSTAAVDVGSWEGRITKGGLGFQTMSSATGWRGVTGRP